jgi:hypothetical protein
MVTRESEVWAATRVLAMHRSEGRCAHCTRDGCRLTVWAETIRRKWADEGHELSPVAPVWSPGTPTNGR